jgi:hypothetical protein
LFDAKSGVRVEEHLQPGRAGGRRVDLREAPV